MNDGKYFFTTPATIKSSSSKKYKTYEVTGHSIEVDEKGHPTQNGFDQTASLMKLYCDTDYESARYLFIDKNGKIIRHLAYSNGVPNSTRPYPGEKELNEIRSYAQKNNCSIIFLHNHPNGYVEPSRADIEMTERMESLLADNSGTRRFAGHIILDTGSDTYGFYDSNFKNWEIRYNGQGYSFDEYYNAIKSGNLKIRHDADPDRKTIFFRIEDDRTPKFLSEIEKAYSKDEWNKDEWIPLFYLKEYGVLEHLEYIHKNSFKDYESLDKRIRSTATKTGTTRCFMLPKKYELTVECSRYASKKEQGKDKGIIESVYFANGSDSILKRYKHSIFDGYNTNRMKIIDDSLDFPFGINMRENITKEKDIKSENIITADILQMIASKTTIWGISQQKAENLVNFLSENNISLHYDPDTLNIFVDGNISSTQSGNKEIITLKDIESFYSNKSVQFQTLKGEPNMKENIEKESVRQNDAGLKAASISGTGSSEMDYRVALAHEIKINMPNLSDGERAAAISILEAGAVSMDMKLSDYVKQTFPNGIFGNFQEAELSARQQGKLINGGVVIDGFGENAKAVIYASRTADFSTWVHEVAHIWQAQLTGKLKQNAEKAFNVENGDWKNSKYVFADGHEDTCGEAFAYGFEDILKNADSEFNTPEKQKIYKKFASYMSRTYNGLEKNIKINDDIKKVYDAFCLVDDNLLSQAEKAVKLEMNYVPAVTTEHKFTSEQMELQYQIVGENSIRSMSKSMERNRILSNLTVAVYLDENLKNLSDASKASRIRIDTGWEKDKTGKWKYETDDSVSRIKNGSSFEKLISTNPKLLTKLTEGDKKLTLNDILDSPELFSIFPFMKDINIRFYDDPDTYRALLDSDGIMINTHYLDAVNGEKGLKGILAHEIQHIIQAAEYNQKQDMTGENLELLYMNTMQKMREEGKRFYDYDTNSVDFGIEKYMKDAGEIEARNVARRIAFSDSERRHKTLRSTEEMMNKMQFQEVKSKITKEETVIKNRNLQNPELLYNFKNNNYFILYGKIFIPYRKLKNMEEKDFINSLITSDNQIVKKAKNEDSFSYKKEIFDNFTKDYNVDIFYCVDNNKFCVSYENGLNNLNVSKLRKFYAQELIDFNKEHRKIISQIKVIQNTAEQIKNELKPALYDSAIELKEIKFSRENFNKLFPLGFIQTPIETVKLGENQFTKLEVKNREKYLDLVYQTLFNPSFIINEFRLKNGIEELSHNYIKSYKDDSIIEGFQSIIVTIDKENISISSHNRNLDNLLSKIKIPEQLNYLNPEVGHLIEQHTRNEQLMVNPTRNLIPAIESAYSTDITGASNPYYNPEEDLSRNIQFQEIKQKTKEKALKKLEKKIDTEIAIDNGAAWEYDENNNKVLKNNSGYHVSYDDKGNVKDVRYDDLGEDIIHTLASVPYNKNESFREFFDRVTNERYSAEEKEQLDSILEKITGVSDTLEPQERVTQIFKNLEEDINGRKFGPEINGDLLTKSFEQLTEKYNSDDIHPAQKELFRKYFDEKIQEELGNKIHAENQTSDELAKIVQTRFITDDISNRILNGKPLEGKDGDQQIALNSIDDVVKYIQSNPQRFERSEWIYGNYTEKIKQADKERSVEKQKTNYVLDKLAAAGIEVITDKEEFERILERENLLQKMQGTLTSEEYRRYFKFNEEDVKRFFEQVNEWQKDNSNPGKLIIVGKAPAIMKVLGISEHFIEVEQSTLDKMVRPEPVYPTDKDGHNLTISDIYDIPLQLADPVMVFKSRTRPEDSYVFFTERKDYLNRAILIPLAIDIKKGRIVIHEITSMYGRREEIEFVKSNIEQDNLIYADKDRYEKWADEKLKELQGQKKSNGERVSQIQFLGQRFTDIGTNLNILTKERLVNFISSQNQTKKQNYILDNQTYGFAYEGKIYLNPEIMNSEVGVHEYTHLWDNYTQRTNPELWEKGKSIFKNTKFWEEVKADPNYADIADNDDLLLSEVHSRICGKMADKVLSRIAEQDGKLTQKTVIDWNKETWNYICEEMMEGQAVNYENGLTSKDLSDFLAMPVKDLVHGKKIIQEYDINKLNQKETKETVSERIARWDYNHDDGDQSWPEYSEVYFDKNNNEFILKQYEGYDDTWDERKITPEELLEEYNDAKRLNGYKNHKIIQELNENFVKSFITQEKQNIPSISDVEKEAVSDPEPSSHSDTKVSDELKFTKTPEFEKPAENIQVEDFDSSSSKTDPEKEEPVINKRQLSYSDFLIEASKLETPEAYEKFFNENFNFQIANFKPIPPIADNKLQLFIDGKATDKVFNDNIEEKRSWARWCFDKGMAMYVPLPEVVKKNGMEVIKKSISICNNLLNTDITREAEAKEQSQEAAEQKKDNEPGASIIGPQLYEGSEWTEEELKLIRHVEIDKIPAFIKDPYMDDIAVPKFTTAFRDPETGEYTMKEQSGWHFAQKMTEHGAVTAIMLTKINDSGVREFLKIEPTQYEAMINRGKELVQEWSEPRFKNTHLQALYKYENDIGISKHETRTNTCGQYFHNFEALCRGSSDGRPPADNEEQAMKYAKEIYMKMSPHEKRRMHKMEKEFLKAKGYTIEEELIRRFYEVQKERVFSKKELELPGHSDESLVNGISVEDGKIRGELDDVSHTKVGDTIRISLTTKNFNGKELRMPVTDMKVVAANRETNTVCLIDEQKNTRYELPLDKFITHRQEVTRKQNIQLQKDNRQAAKIEARQKKKETEDYSFGI